MAEVRKIKLSKRGNDESSPYAWKMRKAYAVEKHRLAELIFFIEDSTDITKQIVIVNDNLDAHKEYFENIIVIENTHSEHLLIQNMRRIPPF